MTEPAHRRAKCAVCNRVCEQRSTTLLVGGRALPADECSECGHVSAKTPSEGEPASVMPAPLCPLCGSDSVVHRVVRDPSGAELPATDCTDCEAVCLRTRVATDREHAESTRNRALSEQIDGVCRELTAEIEAHRDTRHELAEAERARSSLRPAPNPAPCRHCGEAELTRLHLIAGGGHTFEAAS